jgi:hypothetical protein
MSILPAQTFFRQLQGCDCIHDSLA